MEHGAIFPGNLKHVEVRFNMNLNDALLLHGFLEVARNSLEQQIGQLLVSYPQWKVSHQRSDIEKVLDKASLQHNLVCVMESTFRKKLEEEKMLKPKEEPKPPKKSKRKTKKPQD